MARYSSGANQMPTTPSTASDALLAARLGESKKYGMSERQMREYSGNLSGGMLQDSLSRLSGGGFTPQQRQQSMQSGLRSGKIKYYGGDVPPPGYEPTYGMQEEDKDEYKAKQQFLKTKTPIGKAQPKWTPELVGEYEGEKYKKKAGEAFRRESAFNKYAGRGM